MATIEISADLAFDMLELIDYRAEGLREDASNMRSLSKSDVGNEYDVLAESWEEDARTIRRALGIEIDGEG